MRHAVLGAGGIGGLLAAALARSGGEVVLLLRPGSLAAYPGRLRVESVVSLGEGVVVPLLNGVDHVEILRQRFPRVVAAAIRVESERGEPGLMRQKSPFLRIDMAGAEEVQAALRQAGIDCYPRADEATLLWEKLVFLAPIALATTAFDAPLGAVRDDPLFLGCRAEAASAARAAGATIDIDSIRNLHETAPHEMQSSMQKDVAAGVEPELAAISGPILRLGQEHDLPTTSTHQLVDRINTRLN